MLSARQTVERKAQSVGVNRGLDLVACFDMVMTVPLWSVGSKSGESAMWRVYSMASRP